MMKLRIDKGTPYQIIDGLFESAEQQTADLLQLWADTGNLREVSRDEAIDMGFEELGSWAKLETDALFSIDDVVLIVQNRQLLQEYNDEVESKYHG